MKTLKISDAAHAKSTSIVGRLIAENGKMKTYSDAIEDPLSKCVMLSPELLDEGGISSKRTLIWVMPPKKRSYKMKYVLG